MTTKLSQLPKYTQHAKWRTEQGFIYSGSQMLFAAPTQPEWYAGLSVHPDSQEHRANCALVAAAPDLLQACIRAVQAADNPGDFIEGNAAYEFLKDAIAQATPKIENRL